MNPIAFCSYPEPLWLIISENVPKLVYYSHLPIFIIAIVIGFYVLLKGPKLLINQILFSVLFFFSLWVFLDSVFWATNRSDVVMFVWSLQILIEPLVHIGALYLIYVLIRQKDVSFKVKLGFFLLYLPIILAVPTRFTLSGFDVSECLAVEHMFSYYTYVIEIIATLFIVHFATNEYITVKSKIKRKELIFIATGVIFFLLSFSWGALVGSFTEDWNLAQYGLFGMPIFAAFLAYSIVRFKTFNIKLVGAQALIATLAAITGSQFFFITDNLGVILVSISFSLILIFGYLLIRGIKRELEAKEKIETLARQLQTVNTDLASANTKLKILDQQKTEFISFATHQLRSPLTAIKGMSSLILEGDMGPVPEKIKETVEDIYTSVRTQVTIVEDYLNMSRIELGTMKYDMVNLDCKHVLDEAVNELKQSIDAKNLELKLNINHEETHPIHADHGKFKQVIMNTIDNSIKYTPSGSITVSLEKDSKNHMIRIKISDTGVGIRQDVMPKLFQKFTRAPNASVANIHGTGLGLYIAKEIITAHNGRIWAESEGEGKGSQFYIEIPEAK